MRRCLSALVVMLAALPAVAAAQSLADYDYEFLGFRGVSVGAGYLWSDRVRDTEEYHLRFDLGYLGPGVRIIPSLSYWSSRFTQAELEELAARINQQSGGSLTGDDLGPVEWSDLAVSVDGNFVWNTPVDVLTYLGAGLAFHALNGQGAAVDGTFVEDLLDSITAGVSGIAGLEFQPVERFRIYGEGRYTAMNSIQYFSVRAGLQLMFNRGRSVQVGAVPAPPVRGEVP
jgi:opacity protein-like surface antigen